MRWKVPVLAASLWLVAGAVGQEFNEALQKAVKDAAKKAAPSVVQITTLGGTDMVVTSPKGPVFRKALGPTTGVIVAADGYIVSSAFNFINKPTNILVAVPGHPEPYIGKLVATDRSRMITLLKIEASGLPVPTVCPKKEMAVAQWAIAMGRTLDTKRDNPPSISLGIISALDRIWGKAIQTDAKISPINYGGPIVDIQGRVQGILVPASPNSEEETAGFEWYDSGIGFAIPLQDVMAVLPRLKLGKDLKKGVLGVRMKSPDKYGAIPEIADVTKDTAAARAGLKAGDIIVEVEGKPVVRMAQILHHLGPKYEGDKISLKYKRGDQVIALDLELVGTIAVYAHPFLGILPMRDDPRAGVEIRYIYPTSPAHKAGLKEGDRIVKVGGGSRALSTFSGLKTARNELFEVLASLHPGMELEMEVIRKDGKKTDTVKVALAQMPGTNPAGSDVLPDKVPSPATLKKGLEPLEVPGAKPAKVDPKEQPKPETGILKRTTGAGDHNYVLYVHEKYDPQVAHALLIWLHPPGKNKDEDFKAVFKDWEDYCEENHIIMVCPKSENEAGWIATESDFVMQAVAETAARYSIDRQRIVAHGLGVGGTMALYVGFNHRDVVRGACAVGAVLGNMKDNTPAQRLQFFLIGGALDPAIKSISESRTKLAERRFPALYREMADKGRDYPTGDAFREIIRWIDCLDRQ
jgi:S1-C subfamily serine protease/predicted esterase